MKTKGDDIKMIRSDIARGILSLIILIALLLTSFTACTSTITMSIYKDEIGSGKSKGYVAFYSPKLGGQIYSLQDGLEIDEDIEIYGNRPVGIARTPGRHEFIIYHKKNKVNVSVPVFPDAITYVSVAEQVIGKTYSYSTYKYLVHVSVGSTPMPILPESSDSRMLTSALSDKDWGTRQFALQGLIQTKVVPDSTTLERIRFLASRDRYREVRETASELLRYLGEKIPSRPLHFDTFEHNSEPLWYIGSKEGESDYYFDGEGYNIDSKAETWAWEIKDLLELLSDVPNYDIEVDASWKEGVTNFDYGFVLLQDKGNYYHLSISKNGFARVGLIRNSVLQDSLIPWQNHASESIFSNDINNLKLEVRGKDATYFVNGAVIGRFILYDGFMPNEIGLFIYGKQKVVFKSIRIKAR